MPQKTYSNRRIAKNTGFLYVRMLLLLVISLYTSRVVLQVLGINDYGIYNVVNGFVVMFAFVNGALTTGTQRHLSFELGKKDGEVAKIFSACLKSHLLLAIVVLIVLETFGLWFLNTQMKIPIDRMPTVNIIYQISIISVLKDIIRAPFESSIIAYEKMGFYAYIGIIEATLKLVMVFLIDHINYDKLIIYAIIMLFISLCVFFSMLIYVRKKISDIRIVKIEDRSIYKFIFSFTGWTLFGAFAGVLETQGMNIIINIGWGVALNASVGVATQVKTALYQFVSGFQKAINPQLVISESDGNKLRQVDLINKSSRFAFFLMFILVLPLSANIYYVLNLWLDKVPHYSYHICLLLLFISLMECLSYSLYTTIFAIGKIKQYQIIVAIIRLLSVVSAFIISKIDVPPYCIFIAPCVSSVILLLYRVFYLVNEGVFSFYEYMANIIIPVVKVAIVSIVPILFYKMFLAHYHSVLMLLLETIVFVVFVSFIVLQMGVKKEERQVLLNVLRQKFLLK